MALLRATNALEPFVLLAKSATSPRGAADLITQATSAPNTYIFAELLECPNIQALRNSSQYAPYLKLLEIFAWGTIADYNDEPDIPRISDAQLQKLQQLSLLSLAAVDSPISYYIATTALSLPDYPAVESLITSAIANSLISGTMDQNNEVFHVDSIAPVRDLEPGSLPLLTADFDTWGERCTAVLDKLAAEEARIVAAAETRAQRKTWTGDLYERRMREYNEDERAGRGKRVLDEKDTLAMDNDAMDVDGDNGRLKGAKRALMGLTKMMG